MHSKTLLLGVRRRIELFALSSTAFGTDTYESYKKMPLEEQQLRF